MTPTQADREEAAYLMISLSGYEPGLDSRIREGRFDTHAAVECITSVRLAAEAAAFEKAAGVAELEAADIRKFWHLSSDPWQAGRLVMADTIASSIRKLAGEKHD